MTIDPKMTSDTVCTRNTGVMRPGAFFHAGMADASKLWSCTSPASAPPGTTSFVPEGSVTTTSVSAPVADALAVGTGADTQVSSAMGRGEVALTRSLKL